MSKARPRILSCITRVRRFSGHSRNKENICHNFVAETLAEMIQFRVYLEVQENMSGVLLCQQTTHPFPHLMSWHGAINHSIPHYGLIFLFLSNSASKGVGLCLPQMYPNRLSCCLETPAQPHHLVFCLRD